MPSQAVCLSIQHVTMAGTLPISLSATSLCWAVLFCWWWLCLGGFVCGFFCFCFVLNRHHPSLFFEVHVETYFKSELLRAAPVALSQQAGAQWGSGKHSGRAMGLGGLHAGSSCRSESASVCFYNCLFLPC